MPILQTKTFSRQTALFLIIAAFIIAQIASLTVFILKKYAIYKMEDLHPGIQFASFKPHLTGVAQAGYLTDRATSREKISEAFLQAQYYLAPTVLNLNDASQTYAILDSENKAFIIQSIQSMGGGRLSNNAYGQALLKRKGQ